MSDETTGPTLPIRKPPGAVAHPESKSASRIRTGSRLGVWGLAGGVGVMTAFTLGAPISLAAAMALMGAGVFVSGVGTLVASTAVVRGTRLLTPWVRAAAFAGVPLGMVLSLLGLTSLTQWAPLVAIVNALTPAAGILGALVVILLVVSFFVSSSSEEEDDSSTQTGAPPNTPWKTDTHV